MYLNCYNYISLFSINFRKTKNDIKPDMLKAMITACPIEKNLRIDRREKYLENRINAKFQVRRDDYSLYFGIFATIMYR